MSAQGLVDVIGETEVAEEAERMASPGSLCWDRQPPGIRSGAAAKGEGPASRPITGTEPVFSADGQQANERVKWWPWAASTPAGGSCGMKAKERPPG